jgi:hypothetical protein
MLKITNVATVRNYEVITDVFTALGINISGKILAEWNIKLYNYQFAVLSGLIV